MIRLSLEDSFDFKKWERMIVLPHIHPDGDTLGSCIALRKFLVENGLEVYLVNDDRIPANLRFLNFEGMVTSEEFQSLQWEKESYGVFVVDGSDLTRIADRQWIFDQAKNSFCIDHHVTNKGFTDYLWLEEEASSTGELVYCLIKNNGGKVDQEIAEPLYVAISTDTGSFKYDSTGSRTLRVVADLMDTGFDMQKTIVEVYQNKEIDQVRLMQIALNHLKIKENGKVGISYICLENLDEYGITQYDTDGICELIRDIAGLEVAVFLREVREGEFKVSTRSKYDFDVAVFSQCFGGGGHKKAAGFTLKMPVEKAMALILDKLKEQVIFE